MAGINPHQIKYSYAWAMDDMGRVFFWNGGVYRGIYPAAADRVRRLFASGCLEELADRGLFPKSVITDHSLEGFAFVVEHEKVPYVTYAHEWSFTMLRDAALAVLEVGEILGRHGWRLRDCHYQNLLFHGQRPVYVDLGSFLPLTEDGPSAPGPEFLSSYFWPLSIWADGDYYLARRIISSGFGQMPLASWQRRGDPLVRWLGFRWGVRVSRRWQRLVHRVLRWCWGDLKSVPAHGALARLLPAELVSNHSALMRKKLMRLTPPIPVANRCGDPGPQVHPDGPAVTPRLDAIVGVVKRLGCESVVDLAGARGDLSLLLASRTQVRRVVSASADWTDIDRLYVRCRQHDLVPPGKTLQSVVLDFMIPEVNLATTPPAARFRADLVVAPAVNRDPALTRSFPLREVLRAIASHTHRHALVEFVPPAPPEAQSPGSVACGHDHAGFQAAFGEFFDHVETVQLEGGSFLHVGRLRGGPAEAGN